MARRSTRARRRGSWFQSSIIARIRTVVSTRSSSRARPRALCSSDHMGRVIRSARGSPSSSGGSLGRAGVLLAPVSALGGGACSVPLAVPRARVARLRLFGVSCGVGCSPAESMADCTAGGASVVFVAFCAAAMAVGALTRATISSCAGCGWAVGCRAGRARLRRGTSAVRFRGPGGGCLPRRRALGNGVRRPRG